MARPAPKDLPPENQRVWRAWQDAKQRNPDLTLGEFGVTVFGPPRGRGKAVAAKFGTSDFHKREVESRARYVRLIFEGKRRPQKLSQRADNGGVFNVTVGRGKSQRSFNLILPRGVSRLDAYNLLDSPEMKRLAKEQAEAWRQRYDTSDVPDEPTSIRGVFRTTKPEKIFRSSRNR